MGAHRRPHPRLTAATWRITGKHPDCRTAVETSLPPCPPVRVYQPKHARQENTTMTNELTAAETKWGPGPWQNEPDRDQWTDETTGLTCLVRRHGFTGHWCGYVNIPETHPWHQVEYTDLPDIEVHWGVNYSDHMRGEPGWWVGFDCAHLGDLSPHEIVNDEYGFRANDGVYRNLAFVRRECERLAEQINEATR